MGGTTFGIGSQFTYPTSQLNPFNQLSQPNPFGASPFGGQQPYAHPLQQVQQILQTIPAQLQQLIQLVPQHIHQGQQSQVQQPFGQVPLFGAFSPTTPQWGVSPQVFGPQPSHVM
jgi:hypothetical protein